MWRSPQAQSPRARRTVGAAQWGDPRSGILQGPAVPRRLGGKMRRCEAVAFLGESIAGECASWFWCCQPGWSRSCWLGRCLSWWRNCASGPHFQ